jgi:sulfite dehydrogenase (cytochrome) subunit B
MNKQQAVSALLVGLLFLSRGPALADEQVIEQVIKLKDGPGRDVVETNCGICHSLDYIEMNSPFPDEKLWQAEVAKMINVFGALVEPDEAKTVVDYLVSNYGVAAAVPASNTPAAAGPAPSPMDQRPAR